MIDRVKEVDSLEGLVLDGARLGEPVEGTDTGREVVERCEVRQVAAVAAEQDLTEVDEAVDGLLDGGEDPSRRPLPMFHLAVVLEKGDVVDCRLNADCRRASEHFGRLNGTTPMTLSRPRAIPCWAELPWATLPVGGTLTLGRLRSPGGSGGWHAARGSHSHARSQLRCGERVRL